MLIALAAVGLLLGCQLRRHKDTHSLSLRCPEEVTGVCLLTSTKWWNPLRKGGRAFVHQ